MLRYPMNMNVDGRRVVVVGGGRVAGRKLHLLVGTGAAVCVVAAAPTQAVRDHALAEGVELIEAAFAPPHLDGAFAAIAATDSRAANAAVVEAARARGVLVNVADDPQSSDFHVPAVLRRGRLDVTLSTGGACPGFSHALKGWLDGLIGPEIATGLEVVAAVRAQLRSAQGAPPSRDAYERLVGEALFDACRRRDVAALDRVLADTLGPELTAASLGVVSLLQDGGTA